MCEPSLSPFSSVIEKLRVRGWLKSISNCVCDSTENAFLTWINVTGPQFLGIALYVFES